MKKVFISGISGGIGTALAKKYLSEGYYVIGQYNKNLPTVQCEAIQADFSDLKQVEKVAVYLYEKHPDLEILINNAGDDWYGLFIDMKTEEITKLNNVNLVSSMIITKEVGKNMLSNKKGVILNVSSIWGRDGGSCEAAYSATKGGLIAFTKAIAKEWALSGVRCNALCLGYIDTKMNKIFSEEDKKNFCENVALGRIGNTNEVAQSAYFLTTDASSYITGQVLSVDGGM